MQMQTAPDRQRAKHGLIYTVPLLLPEGKGFNTTSYSVYEVTHSPTLFDNFNENLFTYHPPVC